MKRLLLPLLAALALPTAVNAEVTNDYILIAESGIKTSDDIKKFNSTGIYNFLIGESLLKSKDKEKKIGELLLNESY